MQYAILPHNRLASRRNFRLKANLTEVNAIPKSIDEGFERSSLVLMSWSALQVPDISFCPGTLTSEILKTPNFDSFDTLLEA